MIESSLAHFHQHGRFCHPDWWKIVPPIMTEPDKQEREALLARLCREWLKRNCDGLGGGYQVYETPNFHFLSTTPRKKAEETARFFEQSIRQILKLLPGIAARPGEGKHLVMMFDEPDDYYEYISHFYGEGYHPMSGGVCLKSGGYLHVAIPMPTHGGSYRSTLVHEMTHVYLTHHSLPKWLEEAIAMRMEEAVCGPSRTGLRADDFKRHMAFWNPDSIQHFWKGGSWHAAGDSFGLSYELARRIWRAIEGLRDASQANLMTFIGGASREDAGERACREVFGLGLGSLAADFLGRGHWEPRPEYWPDLRNPSAEVSLLDDDPATDSGASDPAQRSLSQ